MPPSQRDKQSAGFIRFLHRVGRLKSIPRTGWLDRDVPPEHAESVADHSFRVALLAWLAAMASASELDADHVLKLALIHDLAEALTGDAPPYDPEAIPVAVGREARYAFLQGRHIRNPERTKAKRAAEDAAMADLLADLPPELTAAIEPLWTELQAQSSPEARFVKQADRLETYLQSREYLANDPSRPMASFAAEVADVITDSDLVKLRDAIATFEAEDAPP